MSVLILVRHGQARAFSENPDRLSATGREQARALGRYWIARGERFDAAYHGSLRRQRETCEAVSAEYRRAGMAFPGARALPGLDEYAAQDLVTVLAPRLAASDPGFAPLWEGWQSVSTGPDRNRRFQLMFEALVSRWVAGHLEHEGLEPWDAFRSRVEGALLRIREREGSGVRVAAFTSGGPIGVAVQACLGASAVAALEVNWRVRNTSLTTFLFSGTRFSLDAFNALPHLSSMPDLVTFR